MTNNIFQIKSIENVGSSEIDISSLKSSILKYPKQLQVMDPAELPPCDIIGVNFISILISNIIFYRRAALE